MTSRVGSLQGGFLNSGDVDLSANLNCPNWKYLSWWTELPVTEKRPLNASGRNCRDFYPWGESGFGTLGALCISRV